MVELADTLRLGRNGNSVPVRIRLSAPNGSVAQLVEPPAHNWIVLGSSPNGTTMPKGTPSIRKIEKARFDLERL